MTEETIHGIGILVGLIAFIVWLVVINDLGAAFGLSLLSASMVYALLTFLTYKCTGRLPRSG